MSNPELEAMFARMQAIVHENEQLKRDAAGKEQLIQKIAQLEASLNTAEGNISRSDDEIKFLTGKQKELMEAACAAERQNTMLRGVLGANGFNFIQAPCGWPIVVGWNGQMAVTRIGGPSSTNPEHGFQTVFSGMPTNDAGRAVKAGPVMINGEYHWSCGCPLPGTRFRNCGGDDGDHCTDCNVMQQTSPPSHWEIKLVLNKPDEGGSASRDKRDKRKPADEGGSETKRTRRKP